MAGIAIADVAMMNRRGNDPKRRIAPVESYDSSARDSLIGRLTYVGSGLHKTKPGDYGFHPPVNPRPNKSICDGLRVILLAEARELFREGIRRGMVSTTQVDGVPKYVWSVDEQGEPYEAKISRGAFTYHGYRLEEEDDWREEVLREWKSRSGMN